MELAEGIRKMGYRKWYERRLIESHAYLVTGLLSMVLALGSIEGLNLHAPGWEPFFLLFLVLASGALAAWAIFRYLAILLHAVRIGERSTCRQCSAYGILEMNDARAVRGDDGREAERAAVAVRCRKCGHEWTIDQQ